MGTWIVRNQDEDFGVDMEVELSDPDPRGHFMKCQVKTSKGAGTSIRLKNSFLRYAYECRVPFILVQIGTTKSVVRICWLQGCIEDARLQKAIYGATKTTVIDSDWFSPLDKPTNVELTKIARGIHPISLVMQIRDLIWSALETGDHILAGLVTNLLHKYNKEVPYFPLDIVIDEVISLGNRVKGTLEGNALTDLLFSLCRSYADHFTAGHIKKLVLRNDSYSRTGINGLSLLYDAQPEYIRSLRLPDVFRSHSDWRVYYFCKLRENYAGVPVTALMSGKYDCDIDTFRLDPRAHESLNEWANRGDCALLDFAYDISTATKQA